MSDRPPLLAVPNLSVGPEPSSLDRLQTAFASGALVLDRHSDAVHGRSVFTLGGGEQGLEQGLLAGAREAIALVDLRSHAGAHPRIGALDVCPIVYPRPELRERASGLARALAARLAELGLPIFLYGELAADEERRERHYFRRGGIEALTERMVAGELAPDLGPSRPHPTAGATLLTARPPLAAFNVIVEGIDLERGRDVAAELRESGGGMRGVRAIAIDVGEGRTQISTNVHDPALTPLGDVVAEVQRLVVPLGGRAVGAELIGLVPEAALAGYPEEVPILEFDPAQRTIEARLRERR